MAGLVECHAGYRYAERPTAIYWQGQRLEISEIIKRWSSPEGRHFTVCTPEGQVFNLVYLEFMDDWQIDQA